MKLVAPSSSRGQTLQTAANDHLFAKYFAFVFHQVNVVRNHHDAVAADDSDQRNEPHPMSDRQAGRTDPDSAATATIRLPAKLQWLVD
jgi:hypothetical protein